MPSPLYYAELESKRADSLLMENGELLVLLPSHHAKALVSFIETVRTVQSRDFKKSSFLKRISFLPQSLWVTATILFGHSRLFALDGVVVLNSRSQTWEQQTTGEVLFIFQS